jgi:hypothetical protein
MPIRATNVERAPKAFFRLENARIAEARRTSDVRIRLAIAPQRTFADGSISQ